MKLNLLRHTIITLILGTTLLPVFPAWGAPPLPPPTPPIPTPLPDADFDHITVFPKVEGDDEQIKFGTPDKDKIIQYGATGNVLQYLEADAGDDWILRVGGDQQSTQTAIAGSGNEWIYQFGGQGEGLGKLA